MPLCGTAHDSVHELLNQYVHHNGMPPWTVRRKFSPYIRQLAEDGWANRPSGKIPYTTAWGKASDT